MPRLPQPGKDSGTWGNILNEFLSQTHKSDGTLKDNIITATAIRDGTITEDQLDETVRDKLNTAGSGNVTDGTITTAKIQDDAITDVKVSPVAAIDQSKIAGLSEALDDKADVSHVHISTDISNSTATGRALMTATDAASARSAIGASSLTIGTSSSTAAAGNDGRLSDTRTPTDNTVSTIKLQDNAVSGVKIADGAVSETKLETAVRNKLNASTPTWNTLSDKPAVIGAGTDATTARDAIGAAREHWIDVRDYGAKGDGKVSFSGAIMAGSSTLSVTMWPFESTVVGQSIGVYGAGQGGSHLITTITGWTDSNTVTLATAASVSVYSAYVSWGTDNTQAFEAAIAASIVQRVALVVPPTEGYYLLDSLEISTSSSFTMRGGNPGWGKFSAFRGPNDVMSGGAVTLRQIMGSSNTLLTASAGEVTLENLYLSGNNRTGDGVGLKITQGMECRLRNVLIGDVKGEGLLVENANNSLWTSVFVMNCGDNDGAGNSIRPSVKLAPVQGSSLTINTLNFDELNIEFSQGVSLEIGPEASVHGNYPEFIRLHNLHIESTEEYGGGVTNLWPLVRLVNLRSVCLIDPFLYGGPGPLVTHEHSHASIGKHGGVSIFGGTLLGRTPISGYRPDCLIHLKSGDQFTMSGTRVDSYSNEVVLVDASYGPQVYVGDLLRGSEAGSGLVTDNRDNTVAARAPHYQLNGVRVTGPTRGNQHSDSGVWLGYSPLSYSHGIELVQNGVNFRVAQGTIGPDQVLSFEKASQMQLGYMNQSGDLSMAGSVRIGGSCTIHSGASVPNDAIGVNGDLYLRTDTPGTASQRIYVKSNELWTGLL